MFVQIFREHGNKVIGELTLDQAYGGARGVKCLVWEVSRSQTNLRNLVMELANKL